MTAETAGANGANWRSPYDVKVSASKPPEFSNYFAKLPHYPRPDPPTGINPFPETTIFQSSFFFFLAGVQ